VEHAIPVPVLEAVREYLSRPVITVKMALTVPDLVSSFSKGTTGIEEGEYGFPDV
jgi:hypothetical protein